MESKYIIKFEIDQRDADNITIATDLRDGKPDRDLLINLCIVSNFNKLKDYDYAWYNLSGMEQYLSSLWNGFIYDACNRFKIKSVEIKGFDGDSMSWYEINDFSLDRLKELGITDIDEAYNERLKDFDPYQDDEDYDEDDDDYDEELGEGKHLL